mmetsp:Transcript_49300/g.122519  ORF Transcript_49300/g.122519 Transcript_49300/m.122519 type:complete len:241 (-) Transcript_49300:302-1024(-)
MPRVHAEARGDGRGAAGRGHAARARLRLERQEHRRVRKVLRDDARLPRHPAGGQAGEEAERAARGGGDPDARHHRRRDRRHHQRRRTRRRAAGRGLPLAARARRRPVESRRHQRGDEPVRDARRLHGGGARRGARDAHAPRRGLQGCQRGLHLLRRQVVRGSRRADPCAHRTEDAERAAAAGAHGHPRSRRVLRERASRPHRGEREGVSGELQEGGAHEAAARELIQVLERPSPPIVVRG